MEYIYKTNITIRCVLFARAGRRRRATRDSHLKFRLRSEIRLSLRSYIWDRRNAKRFAWLSTNRFLLWIDMNISFYITNNRRVIYFNLLFKCNTAVDVKQHYNSIKKRFLATNYSKFTRDLNSLFSLAFFCSWNIFK